MREPLYDKHVEKFQKLYDDSSRIIDQIMTSTEITEEQRHYDGKIALMMQDYFKVRLTTAKIEAEIKSNPSLQALRPLLED